MAEDVTVELHDFVADIVIHRGPANFFDARTLGRVADIGEQLSAGGRARVIVLSSAGKHFCAGADFGSSALEQDRDRAAAEIYGQGARLFGLRLPIVAAVQGAAVGGGLGLACAADYRVASPRTRFVANFSALGFHHGFGLSITLPRIIGDQRALDLLLTARRVDGTEAHRIGLADRLVDEGSEREGALTMATEIASRAPLAVHAIRQTLRSDLAAQVRSALSHELEEQSRLWRTEDSRTGLAASRAREMPRFTGR
ncbi:enoyl-CoA hydratase/isomerase family protein [Amycolatopsis pithecellobii]|uniref:Enoyl-CoA hydratase/isomerase family protein n=1 Tax=Amycolatopsis pithecellobii TaxID=664692 RepID=A0A6N7Z3N4_9PSEU|nr:enoyl-CoA hydratase/isomerase family protein [Amycolatopsis pithecellobii]MTD54704.1 enoyl-CoA hydratase/isomerase family protein [Amycolatopsis pithecellobii]